MGLGPFGENPKQSIDIVLPNNLTFEDLYDPKDFREESFSLKLSTGHVHHKDGNPENNNPHNLILLCRDCHARIQSQLRNDMNKRKS
jgi:5-methylcytosine-specific restriction endonuclease McrA